ncbi:MAG: glycosyltransferase family 2 protein [Gammaproteobacteria bacterium]|nr:glycosyltransferase family 2 protein [Gammaproteobacteria bacterium]
MPQQALVTILIPSYKTPMLTKLCLRLIRKHTDLSKARVVVIDNDSKDESLAYLRGLAWIDLIERPAVSGETGPAAHSAALDLGLARTVTPYVLSIHTDTLVKHPQWLEFLIKEIEKNPRRAGVGSWKLEFKPGFSRFLKSIEFQIQQIWYRLLGKKEHALAGVGDNYFYLRSHCALYRTQLLQDQGLSFSAGGEVAGKVMHKALLEQGYEMAFLRAEILGHYIEHLNHATMVLNPEFHENMQGLEKSIKRVQKGLQRFHAEAILADDSLDE